MKQSSLWLDTSAAQFSAGTGRTGYAYLRHYTAQFQEWGSGPPLLLVPGLAGGYGLLGPLARRLSAKFHVISYQLRGEDDCFALRQHFDLDDLVSDLAEFVNWHRLENPVLMGVSFGGVLALEYAVRYPKRIQKLVVQGAGVRFENGLLPRVASAVLSRFPLPSDNPFINQFFSLLFGGKQKPSPLLDFVTRQCWQTDQGVMAHRLNLLNQYDVGDRVERIGIPTLVLAGERDLMVSEGSLKGLVDGLPHGTCKTLTGCGHLAFVTHPNRVAAEVERFAIR